ncbi:MAG: DNA-protecting protein DprA [Desulfobacterales bacterium]|nr:DNA-protecting protein DprA [Desulfobacterales bacterium]
MDHLIPWLTLKGVPGVGNLLFKRLVDRFTSPARILATSPGELVAVDGVTDRLARTIGARQPDDDVFRKLDRLAQTPFEIVVLTGTDYPHLLREIPDPPPILYVYGRLTHSAPHIAVVGSRHPTAYGKATAHRLGADLATMGIVVVSGMALGIDTAAHEGSLHAGGPTTAVLGSGLDWIYPPENQRLFHRIAEAGAVVSEFDLDAEPDRYHFPMRNRVISGMSLGTVVVEATRRSGSLITARLAADQNREVFAVPGSVQSFKSAGTHQLIREGACLVTDARDIIAELTLPLCPGDRTEAGSKTNPVALPQDLAPDEAMVLAALEPYAQHIDDLVRILDMDPGSVSALLLKLELLGLVRQESGARFSRK